VRKDLNIDAGRIQVRNAGFYVKVAGFIYVAHR
jgi:hypothetical protein